MGGDHSCVGCGRMVGMPHAEECTYAVDPRDLVWLSDTVEDPMRGVRASDLSAPGQTARELAARLLYEALEVSPRAAPDVALVLATRAQAAAALAQTYEVGALREALLGALGDGSHLDRVGVRIQDAGNVVAELVHVLRQRL